MLKSSGAALAALSHSGGAIQVDPIFCDLASCSVTTPRAGRRGPRLVASLVIFGLVFPFAFAGAPALALDGEAPSQSIGAEQPLPPIVMGYDNLDLEDHDKGYTSQYIFGMTKGVMRSTLMPAFKPMAMLLTVPLDLVFLPFAALGGFFR
jgi:hypothetical protein